MPAAARDRVSRSYLNYTELSMFGIIQGLIKPLMHIVRALMQAVVDIDRRMTNFVEK